MRLARFGVASSVLFILLPAAVGAGAQAADAAAKPLQWDVISVKPMGQDGCPEHQGGIRWLHDGLTASCVPVAFVVQCAYRLMDRSRIVGLPVWAQDNSHLYAIEARVSGGDAEAYGSLNHDQQFRMLQQVLAERFQTKAHMATRALPAYDLVVAKGGPRLNGPGPNESGTTQWSAADGHIHWTGAPLTNFVWVLSNETGRPVVDKTGLTGRYSFLLDFEPAARAAKEDNGKPSVFTALEEQLGLKLVPAKEPVDVLVIDAIEQPTAN